MVIMCIVAVAAELKANSFYRVTYKKKNSLKRTLLNTQPVVLEGTYINIGNNRIERFIIKAL